jgi:octaprenyl-diphosphate synthase
VEALGRYGRYVGQAFQIADDLLDLSGDEKATGKTLGTDVEQGKLTLPLIHLLRSAPDRLAARARQILTTADGYRRESLRTLLIEAGSLEYARLRALRLTEQARRELTCLPPSPCRSILEAMTDRVVHRES